MSCNVLGVFSTELFLLFPARVYTAYDLCIYFWMQMAYRKISPAFFFLFCLLSIGAVDNSTYIYISPFSVICHAMTYILPSLSCFATRTSKNLVLMVSFYFFCWISLLQYSGRWRLGFFLINVMLAFFLLVFLHALTS